MKTLTPTPIQKINDKLDLLCTYHEELVEDLPAEEEFVRCRVPRRAIEKTIELIADALLDIAMIIVSAKGLEKPAESSEAITVLQKQGILSAPLAAKIKDLIRFRNLLVHQYAKVNEQREYQNIAEHHEDIPAFIREIEQFVMTEKKNVVRK